MPRTKTSQSHSGNATDTTDLTLDRLSLSSEVTFSLMPPIFSFVMFICFLVLTLRLLFFVYGPLLSPGFGCNGIDLLGRHSKNSDAKFSSQVMCIYTL